MATISGRDLREYEASLRGWAGRRADDDNDNHGSRHQGGDSRGDGQPAKVNWKQGHPPTRMYQHETPVLLHYRCCVNCEEYDCSSSKLLPNTGASLTPGPPNGCPPPLRDWDLTSLWCSARIPSSRVTIAILPVLRHQYFVLYTHQDDKKEVTMALSC